MVFDHNFAWFICWLRNKLTLNNCLFVFVIQYDLIHVKRKEDISYNAEGSKNCSTTLNILNKVIKNCTVLKDKDEQFLT